MKPEMPTAEGRAPTKGPQPVLQGKYHVFLASPGDVNAERKAVREFFKRYSPNSNARDRLAFEVIDWENYSSAGVGRPQELITSQTLARYEKSLALVIAIIGHRFGSPTGTHESGTQEELEWVLKKNARDGFPELKLFFRENKQITFDSSDIDNAVAQFKKVKSFRKKVQNALLFKTYKDLNEFTQFLNTDVAGWLNASERPWNKPDAREETEASPHIKKAEALIDDRRWLRNYLSEVAAKFERIPLSLNVDPAAAANLTADSVYVPMRLSARNLPMGTNDPDFYTQLLNRERVALLGEPGSGKSTLLRYIGLDAARSRLELLEATSGRTNPSPVPRSERRRAYPIPIMIDLAKSGENLRRIATGEQQVTGEGLTSAWIDFFGTQLHLDPRRTRSLFDGGEILFLFDSLDEIVETKARKVLVGSLYSLQRAFGPRNAVFVTCREAAWGADDEYADFEQVRIERMDRDEIKQYLTRFCRAFWGEKSESVLSRLLQSLQTSELTANIASNPQMATMLAVLNTDGRTPTGEARLFKEIVEKLTTRRNLEETKELRKQLMRLAVCMQSSRDSDGFPVPELRVATASELLVRPAAESNGDSKIQQICIPGQDISRSEILERGESLLNELAWKTGLLTVDPPTDSRRFVRFRHRTFQEFLAASHFADSDSNLVELLQHATDPDWARTLGFTAELLALFSEDVFKNFLIKVLREPACREGTELTPEQRTEWAPRVAAATACLNAVAPYRLQPSTLEPARRAHEMILPVITDKQYRMDLKTRIRIAEGLGLVADPRLETGRYWRWEEIPKKSCISGSDDEDAWIQEKPAFEKEVGDFLIHRWPVTVKEYRRFMEWGDGYHRDEFWSHEGLEWRQRSTKHMAPLDWREVRLKGNYPITGISWWEAEAFCRWYTSDSDLAPKHTLTLPTEEQWERAARGSGSLSDPEARSKRFPWGQEWKPRPAEEDLANCATTRQGLVPVGLFPRGHSQPHGLWDMAGNVSEWCLDQFVDYARRHATSTGGSSETNLHVIRGGHFDSSPLNLRVSCRFGALRDSRSRQIGFRCVAIPCESR